MDVACPNCPAMYPISEQKLAGRLVRFRCKACGHAIVLDGRPNPSQPPSSQAPGSVSLRPVPQDSIPVSALYPSDSPATPQPLSAAKTILQQAPAAASMALAGSRQPGPSAAGAAGKASFEPFAGTPGRAPANLGFTGRGPNPDAELDPSVYEDETVAMTAHELESVADAKNQRSSTAPPAFRHQPPPKPLSSVPPAPPPMTERGDPHVALSPSGPPAPPSTNLGHAPHQQPRRAESWSVGQPPNAGTPPPTPAPNLWQQPPPPAYTPLNDVTTAGSAPAERRWVFPTLLVLLAAGGLLVGGLLGKTWLARLWGDEPAPLPYPSAVVPPAEGHTLPLFDARLADARLAQAAVDAVNCLNADTAPLTGVVSARFLPSGKLDAVNLTGTVADAAESPCIRSVFEKIQVAPFQGNSAQVERPIELRPRP